MAAIDGKPWSRRIAERAIECQIRFAEITLTRIHVRSRYDLPPSADLKTGMSTVRQIDQLPQSADVVIIGAGIVGAASAYFLGRSGRQPIVIERLDSVASATTSVSP